MRTISTKTLCLLFGVLVPSLGVSAPTQAGVIPWLYDSIFGYGWGGGYGGGYGGSSYGGGGYSGYSGTPYGASYGYSGGYAAPVYSAPVMPSPVAPTDGTYNSLYGPSVGYYDAGYGYSSPSYTADSGSCCTPCSSCANGDCGTSIQSSKPGPLPTPVEERMPVTPKKPTLPPDHFGPTDTGAGTGGVNGRGIDGRGIGGRGVGGQGDVGGDALPESELRPMRRSVPGGVQPDTNLSEPVQEEVIPGGQQLYHVVPTDSHIAVRYVPSTQRSQVVIPRASARVVRVDRSVREQLIQAEPKSQLASSR